MAERLVVEVRDLSSSLEPDPDGLWRPVSLTGRPLISYPDVGHQNLAAVEATSFWFKHRNEIIASAVSRYLKAGESMVFLDVGGGTGAVSTRLASDLSTVWLLEPGERGAVTAKRRGISTVICSTLEEAAFLGGSFQAVGLFDVIEHLRDEGTLLDEVYRVMGSGGHIFVTVPAYNALWSQADQEAGHFRRYTRSLISRTLMDRGFQVKCSTYFFTGLIAPIFLMRAVPWRVGVRLPDSREHVERDHRRSMSIAGRAVGLLHSWETGAIRSGLRVPFGASVLAVGFKP